MKVYHLTIVYDEETDEVEYIEETLDQEDGEPASVDYLKALAESEGWDSSTTLSLLEGWCEKAEA